MTESEAVVRMKHARAGRTRRNVLTPFNRIVGARLKVARVGAGMTQEALGQRLGVVRCEIANAERGRHTLRLQRIIRWCRACGKDVGELMTEIVASIDAAEVEGQEP